MGTLALVGAVGGAGTTRTSLEVGAALARGGHAVAVLDAAYATQGLADHVPGRIDTDATALCLGDAPIAAGLRDLSVDAPGRLAVCPAHAPFERIARAKAPEAAQRLEDHIHEASRQFDHVVVDTPPVAANQAVAAVNATARLGVVAPATPYGDDGLPRMTDRLADVGATGAYTVRTFTDDDPDADAVLPEHATTDPGAVPAAATGTDAFAAAAVDAAETLLGVDLAVEFDEPGLLSRFRD